MSNKSKIREDAMSLNPIDDALFQKMAEDISFCQEILQVILSDKELRVLDNLPQFVAKNLQGRSCTLDVKCLLGDGRIVNIEVQKADDDDHQRRVRYNGALLTTNVTDPGDRFKDVPDVIVVFISRFDVFKSGKALYHVDRIVRETGSLADNGFAEIYVNAEVDDGSDVALLMDVFTEDNIYDDSRFPATSGRKRRFKTTEEGVSEMCEVIERYKAEGIAEGVAKGKAEVALEMLKEKMSVDMVARFTMLTVEQVKEIGKKNALI
ncbi:Rpn family recombination-promoting nuclease/putative transposase [Anaerovibrio sp.]|uniref:Rpn family recombination-promoting nuclease/putative transposase n=1 Tax=Anaerovibrio sp. TaxID=1872532 RepID=UPI00388EF6E1